jgi:hypothetical protein
MNNRFVPKFTIGFKRFKNEFWNAICKRFKPIVNFGKRPSKFQDNRPGADWAMRF